MRGVVCSLTRDSKGLGGGGAGGPEAQSLVSIKSHLLQFLFLLLLLLLCRPSPLSHQCSWQDVRIHDDDDDFFLAREDFVDGLTIHSSPVFFSFFFFYSFEVDITSHTPILLSRPTSVHSCSAS